MKTIDTINAMIAEQGREAWISARNELTTAAAQLQTIYRGHIDGKPAETVAEYVKAVGEQTAAAVIASLINARTFDGRISAATRRWAESLPEAFDAEAAERADIRASIHSAHLEQIARAMMTYAAPVEPEQIAEPEQPAATFAPSAVTVAGVEFVAAYSIEPSRSAVILHVEDEGESLRIRIPSDHELFAAALAAAQGETVAVDESAAVALCGTAEPVAEQIAEPVRLTYYVIRSLSRMAAPLDAIEAADLERPVYVKRLRRTYRAKIIMGRELEPAEALDLGAELAADVPEVEAPREPKPERTPEQQAAKAAHGAVPDKLWIGSSFEGKGWKILFDAEYDRTRVIFARKPSAAALDAVKAAGFYWSPSLKSWNKGLTWKAFRASESLRLELKRICG